MIRLIAGLAALTLAFGTAGDLAAPFDSLALLRVPAALVLAVTAFALTIRARLVAWIFAATLLVDWALPKWPGNAAVAQSGPGTQLTLFQKNAFYRNQRPADLVADILASGADVVTLQEISSANQPILDALSSVYPNVQACWYRGWRVAVLSRLPFTQRAPLCAAGRGLAAAEIETPAGPVWIASVHNPWPWPHHGWERGIELADLMTSLPGQKIVAGDFNTVPWSATVRRMRRATGGRVLGPVRPTLWLDPVRMVDFEDITGVFQPDLSPVAIPMPIDLVIAPGGAVTRHGKTGSDHMSLLAQIVLPAGAAAE